MKIILFLFIISICLNSCFENKVAYSEPTNKPPQAINTSYFQQIPQFEVPTKLSFCGEDYPLEDPTIKEKVEREFYLLLQQPGQLILYLKRSGRYFPMYEEKLKQAGMPDDLKYLSVAESALYMARSKANAVGLWQFIKGTAKRYGLKVNKYVDERRNPEKSTDAALQYLKKAHNDFNSWSMAAAAYNMGGAGLNKNRKHQGFNNYFDLHLNSETSRYLFRIAVIKHIMENKDLYGINLSENHYYKPYDTRVKKVNSGIRDLNKWAVQQGTTYRILKLYNPWIISKTLNGPGRGNYWYIALPR